MTNTEMICARVEPELKSQAEAVFSELGLKRKEQGMADEWMTVTFGDTLVARITPCLENGKTAYVDFLPHDRVGWGSTEYIVMRPMPPLPNEFAYCLARSPGFREFAIQNMTGTSGRQRVPAQVLSQFLFPSPPEPIAARFGKVVQPLFARASEAIRESRTLAALRDALLPKLVSGELRVTQLETASP